jgi:hypothetical protein
VDYDPANMDFVLLLEDMSPARMPDQVEGLTLEEAGRAIDAAAGLHGAWWRSPELTGHGLAPDAQLPEMKALEPMYQQCWPAVVDFIGDRMSPYARRAGEAWPGDRRPHGPGLRAAPHPDARRLPGGQHDVRGGTLGGALRLVDWQIVMQGPAAFDLAYMLSGSLEVETRRAGQDDLIARHHAGLVRRRRRLQPLAGPRGLPDLRHARLVLAGRRTDRNADVLRSVSYCLATTGQHQASMAQVRKASRACERL